LERETKNLTQIDAALKRIDHGEFGICLDCEEAIAPKRLAALPWAGYCLHCQELHDARRAADSVEAQLAAFPSITVPTITLEGDANGAPHPEPRAYEQKFSGKYAHRTITGGIGHNLPLEAPAAFAQAILDVDAL
jgi:pimeloyl-ACP methyl ester carboxylesterase